MEMAEMRRRGVLELGRVETGPAKLSFSVTGKLQVGVMFADVRRWAWCTVLMHWTGHRPEWKDCQDWS